MRHADKGLAPRRDGFGLGFSGGSSAGQRIAAAVSGGQTEPVADVIAAGADIVAREGMAYEAIGRRRRQPEGEAAIFRAVRWPGREHLGAKNLAAQGAGDLAERSALAVMAPRAPKAVRIPEAGGAPGASR